LNKWVIEESQEFNRKVLIHNCGEPVLPVNKNRGYLTIGFLDEFICTDCEEFAPREMADAALLAGARLSIRDLYHFQMNISFKVLLTIMGMVESKLDG